MALPPLTHHEILALVEPFTRGGLRLDLAASDRVARRLEFHGTDHAATSGRPALREDLSLDAAGAPRLVLTRRVHTADGLAAALHAEGDQGAELLQRVRAVPLEAQFRVVEGRWIALVQRLAPPPAQPVLREAEAKLPGLTLRMTVSGVSGFPAELELLRQPGTTLKLPDDLLAVQGRAWDRLTELNRGWIGLVQLRGEEPARSRDAEVRLEQLVRHLLHTLAAPPAQFHERHYGARWRVAMRGTLPVLVGVGLVGLAFGVQRWAPERASLLAVLANIAPPLLMGLFFLRREMPRIGLPRVPRRPAPDAWGRG